jgi:hypothetical protein
MTRQVKQLAADRTNIYIMIMIRLNYNDVFLIPSSSLYYDSEGKK